MIDHTTLPITPAGGTLIQGQRFTILGHNFDLWPTEIVLGYSQYQVQDQVGLLYNLMRLVEKSNSHMVFEVYSSHTFPNTIQWAHFGTPLQGPRQLLDYRTL